MGSSILKQAVIARGEKKKRATSDYLSTLARDLSKAAVLSVPFDGFL
jgi:hypothetical protein